MEWTCGERGWNGYMKEGMEWIHEGWDGIDT